MRKRHSASITQGLAASVMVCLALACVPAVSSAADPSDSPAEAVGRATELLARGAGYAQPHGEPHVRALQRRLRALGQRPGPVDGLYGPLTEEALERLQRDSGISVDGIFGPQTRRVLGGEEPPLAPGAGYGQPGGSSQVRAVQQRLRALGQRPGPVDGLYGPQTEAAIKRFQRTAGLPATGVLSPAMAAVLAAADPDRPARRTSDTRGANEPGQQGRHTAGQAGASGADDRPRRADSSSPTGGSDQSRTRIRKAADDRTESTKEEPTSLLLFALVALASAAIGGLLASLPKGRRRRTKTRSMAGSPVAAKPDGSSAVAKPSAGSTASSPESGRQRNGAVALGSVSAGEAADGQELPDQLAAINAACRQRGLEPNDVIRHLEQLNDTGPEAIRAVGYATAPEGEPPNGARLREQTGAIDAFCEQRGWRLLELVRDVEDPGVKVLDRPGLAYALERVAKEEASCLVVSQLRRLSPSASDLGPILESIASNNGRLVAMDLGIDTASPAGRKAANVLISVGAWQRERIEERTRKGLQAARAKGHRVGRTGVAAVPELKERIAVMRASGMTLQAIADRLNEDGTPTLRGGEKWRPSSVHAAVGYRRPRRHRQNGGGSAPATGGA